MCLQVDGDILIVLDSIECAAKALQIFVGFYEEIGIDTPRPRMTLRSRQTGCFRIVSKLLNRSFLDFFNHRLNCV
jgi:hypothetical protein